MTAAEHCSIPGITGKYVAGAAKVLGINISTIRSIARGEGWKHIK